MADQKPKSRGLGRGLSALMADVAPEKETTTGQSRADQLVPVERIVPNPDQPRRVFAPDALEELADSISTKGIIQPLIVRRHPSDPSKFEIVAGERRWRAAQRAQLHEVPVVVRDFNDTEVLEVAIIENIQRADLNPVDEAAGYRQLMERFGHTQEQLAVALGKSRSHIANHMRLLNLPDDVLQWLSDGKLSAGHARALVGHDDATALAQEIIKKGLSVRDAERLAKRGNTVSKKPVAATKPQKDADTAQIEAELTAHLGMRVSIDHDRNGESGIISLKYKDLNQLDDLMRKLTDN